MAGYYEAGVNPLASVRAEVRETIEAVVSGLRRRTADEQGSLRCVLLALLQDAAAPEVVAAFPVAGFRLRYRRTLEAAVAKRTAATGVRDQPARQALLLLQARQLCIMATLALKSDEELQASTVSGVAVPKAEPLQYHGTDVNEDLAWASLRPHIEAEDGGFSALESERSVESGAASPLSPQVKGRASPRTRTSSLEKVRKVSEKERSVVTRKKMRKMKRNSDRRSGKTRDRASRRRHKERTDPSPVPETPPTAPSESPDASLELQATTSMAVLGMLLLFFAPGSEPLLFAVSVFGYPAWKTWRTLQGPGPSVLGELNQWAGAWLGFTALFVLRSLHTTMGAELARAYLLVIFVSVQVLQHPSIRGGEWLMHCILSFVVPLFS